MPRSLIFSGCASFLGRVLLALVLTLGIGSAPRVRAAEATARTRMTGTAAGPGHPARPVVAWLHLARSYSRRRVIQVAAVAMALAIFIIVRSTKH
jgi:hypothetical protein